MENHRRVAFVCSRMTNSFTRTVWYALQDSARTRGIRLTAVMGGPVDHPQGSNQGARVYGLLDDRNFDGVILYTGALSHFQTPDPLGPLLDGLGNLPVVSLGFPLKGVTSVVVDQASAVKSLVGHLYEVHGHRRFALVTGPLGQLEARIRRIAFYEELAALGVSGEHIREFAGNYGRSSGIEAVRELSESAWLPLALVCSSDEEALGALEEASALGISVPGSLAVVGFDDSESAANQDPGLTTVGLPLILEARKAMELLVQKMETGGGAGETALGAEIVFRGSCGCTASRWTKGPAGKESVIRRLLKTQTNISEGFFLFLERWLADYFQSFETLLDRADSADLKSQWELYFRRIDPEQARGLPFRSLFAGLEELYAGHPAFTHASQENLFLAGDAESFKSIQNSQHTRDFFFQLHAVELEILKVNDRTDLARVSFQDLVQLGVYGIAVVQSGVSPTLVYFRTMWTEMVEPSDLGPIEYPALLPPELSNLDQPSDRVVASLTAEDSYLGYVVFWVKTREVFVCDFLANQFAGALQRLELMGRVNEQRESLQKSLEESKRMQQQLVETEKVASLGRLVAGVAHEINTPLGTGITGTSFVLDKVTDIRSQFEAGTLAKSGLGEFLRVGEEALSGVLRNLIKAGDLVQAFKGLGLDHGKGEWKPVEIRNLFMDLNVLYSGELAKRGVTLECGLPEKEVLIYSQPSALVQVAGELLENAMEHAFPPGFTGEPVVLLQVSVEAGFLKLAVTDNGRGLEPEERRHLFDPLYTTRRTQGHAGLGLHLAFQLVSRTLGGQMTVATEIGSGTCFLCSIPLKGD